MNDRIAVVAMVISFALLVTVHASIAASLAKQSPRWRALVALIGFPLAPYFAYRANLRARAVAWTFLAIVYVATMVRGSLVG